MAQKPGEDARVFIAVVNTKKTQNRKHRNCSGLSGFFGIKLPSVLLNISSDKFIRLYDASDNVVCTSLSVN